MTTTYTLRPMIREMIATCIQGIRETRANRSVPALLGCGWTVAIKDSNSLLNVIQRDEATFSYDFTASWNRKSTYWTKSTAIGILNRLQATRPELRLVVAHHNDLRDRQEKSALECLCNCFKQRNHKG